LPRVGRGADAASQVASAVEALASGLEPQENAMKSNHGIWLAGVVAALSLSAAFAPNAYAANDGGNAEVIGEWNQILESVLPAGGLAHPRNYAMMHIAMFDAVNALTRTHRPYHARVRTRHWAYAELAAAQAARDVLTAQFPASQAIFDAALETRLANAAPHDAKVAVRIGKIIATSVLTWRQDDGWNTAAPPYALPPLPGLYQPTPPAFTAPAFRQFQFMRPFALLTATQYLPPAPPTLTSEQYAIDFNAVKELGAVNSTVRTAEQTQLARLFAGVTSRTQHWGLWNGVARETAAAAHLSLIETARLFALLNVAIHDGLQTSHTSKFVYGFWRPVTAIRRADEDLNSATVADANWTPLLTTPAYPSHAGNMACVGASAARALALFHGTDVMSFTAKWLGAAGQPDVSRNYSSFWQLALDQANSRIYGGIHFSFESRASQESCPKVAEYVYANFMQRVDSHQRN
jgi:hypothetical protein